jgi:hypothetical protein
MGRLVRPVAVILGVAMVANGVWALVDPQSFYEQLATYPPYNRHLFHDVGAFSIGLGAAVLLAFVVRDALVLGLSTLAVGATFHAISHIIDRDLGGRTTDPYALSLFALVVIAAALVRARDTARR